jgi:hypothetical protein
VRVCPAEALTRPGENRRVDWIIAFGTNFSSPRVNTVPELALAESVMVAARVTRTTIARSFRIGSPSSLISKIPQGASAPLNVIV